MQRAMDMTSMIWSDTALALANRHQVNNIGTNQSTPTYMKQPYHIVGAFTQNHLKEKLPVQAQPRHPRILCSHLCSIPQCMISHVQPLAKSSIWDTKVSSNEFFEFDPSPMVLLPLLHGTTFLGGSIFLRRFRPR